MGPHPQNLRSPGPGGLHLPPEAVSASEPLPWQGQLLQHLLGTLPPGPRHTLAQI